MGKKDYNEIFTRLLSLFPNPDTELKFSTPFQLLIAVMLSAQTTDRQVNTVTDKLFITIKNPKDILNLSERQLAKKISSVNYYKVKAKHIRETAEELDNLANNSQKNLTKNEQKCLKKY